MTKRAKRLEKLRRNPKNVSKDELDSILVDFNFPQILLQVRMSLIVIPLEFVSL